MSNDFRCEYVYLEINISVTMKFVLFIALTILSGCCLVSSQDCGCKPPEPELLIEAKSWIESYQEDAPFVFKSDNGILDTFTISKNSTTEFCGGDECGSNCKIESATLTSLSNPALQFHVSAHDRQFIDFRGSNSADFGLYASLNVSNEKISSHSGGSADVLKNYKFLGDSTFVVYVYDDQPSGKFEFLNYTVAKDFGLIEFTRKDGQVWRREF